MVIVSGSLAYDQIMDFPGSFSQHIDPSKLHVLNVSFLVDKMRKGFGGTAGNIAYTLSLLGVKCALLGVVGEDFTDYRNFLNKNEVDTSYLKTLNNFQTSAAFGITDSRDNQIWGFYQGADQFSDSLSIKDFRGKIDFAVVAPQNPRTMLKFAREYVQKRKDYLFDPGMQLPWLTGADLKDAFAGAKIIIGNDYEIGMMEKKTGLKNLHEAYPQKIIITTLGEHGSLISFKGKKFNIRKAKAKSARDPAGAGDAFRAGFVAGYLRKFPLEVCGQMGSVAAVYTVEKFGTSTHQFTLDEFRRRYRENFHSDLAL